MLVKGYVAEVVISCGAEVKTSPLLRKGRLVFDPIHYLPLLEQKTAALDQAAPLQGWQLPEEFATLRRLLESRMGRRGKREFVQPATSGKFLPPGSPPRRAGRPPAVSGCREAPAAVSPGRTLSLPAPGQREDHQRHGLPGPPAGEGGMSNRSTLLLEHHLKELRLPTFLREYRKLAAQCAAENVDHPDYLLRLSELELIDRHQRMVQRRIRAARFPAVKSLDTFDFLAIPSVNKQLVMELARCEYIEHRENVIAVGNSGTGKTHVALGLGLAACQKGMSVGFTTAAALVHELIRPETSPAAQPAAATGPPQASHHRRVGLRPPLHHRCGTPLRGLQPALRTGLRPGHHQPAFDEWTDVFGSERLTGALLDRLTHHVHILE